MKNLNNYHSFLDRMNKNPEMFQTPEEISAFLKGKEIEILRNTNTHNYGAPGTRFVIKVTPVITGMLRNSGARNNNPNAIMSGCSVVSHLTARGNSISTTDFNVITESKDDVEKIIKFYNSKIKDYTISLKEEQSKLEYMEKLGIDTITPDIVKRQVILDILSSKDKNKSIEEQADYILEAIGS